MLSTKQQKEEAIIRMELIGINPGLLDFPDEIGKTVPCYDSSMKGTIGLINSSSCEPLNTIYETILHIEESYNRFVYAAIIDDAGFISLCYVHSYDDEWNDEKKEIQKYKELIAYVINPHDPMLSEAGTIGFNCTNEFLFRTY